MKGPCMCGDIYCPSCGPLQGNWKCEVCGKWSEDGGCVDANACRIYADEQYELLQRDIEETERLLAAHWDELQQAKREYP